MQPPLDGSPQRPSTPFYLRPLSLCPSARTRGVPALLLRPLMRRGRKRTSYVDRNHGKAHPEGGRHPALFPRPLATPPMATPHRQSGNQIVMQTVYNTYGATLTIAAVGEDLQNAIHAYHNNQFDYVTPRHHHQYTFYPMYLAFSTNRAPPKPLWWQVRPVDDLSPYLAEPRPASTRPRQTSPTVLRHYAPRYESDRQRQYIQPPATTFVRQVNSPVTLHAVPPPPIFQPPPHPTATFQRPPCQPPPSTHFPHSSFHQLRDNMRDSLPG